MATSSSAWLLVTDLRRGRNGLNPPHALSENECRDAVNVDFYQTMLGRKRGGSASLSMTGSIFTGKVSSLGRHVPTSDGTLAELWATDDAATPIVNRLAGGTTWAAPTLKDNPTGKGWDFDYASSTGKFFIAYQSGVDRLHCWDGSTVRRTGLASPAAPSVANTGAGTYGAVYRTYRVRWTVQSAGVTTRRSEPSAATAFTPSGAGTAARVTEPTAANEGETHWEIEVSQDGATFFVLAAVVVGTTTYDDSALTTTYGNNTVSASIGTYTVQPSYRFIALDNNRLLGFGCYATNNKQNRIEISAVIGELNISDNERVPLGNFLDLDENDSGAPTGLIGPVLGAYFAFKETQIWKLTPTGNPIVPYSRSAVSKTIGAVNDRSITVGEDEYGNPCIYWIFKRGIYRYGSSGIEFIGGGVSDLIIGPTSIINITSATKTLQVGHVLWHTKLRQVWFWIAVGSETEPQTTLLVYNLGKYGGFLAPTSSQSPSGWSRFTGGVCNARASVSFSNTVGASMSLDLSPYICYSVSNNAIRKLDTSDLDDAGTPFKAYVTTKTYFADVPNNLVVNRCYLLAKSASGVTITQTLSGNFGIQTSTDTVNLTPSGTETWVTRRFEDARMADTGSVEVTVGDASAVASAQWQLDQLMLEYLKKEIA